MEADHYRHSQSYYSLLGVDRSSSVSEIRKAYRKLAMQWHPDKWTRTPLLAEEAKRRFQQIQEAYSVLSHQNRRTLYDAGLYDPDEEEDEVSEESEMLGFSDFVQEMLTLMSQVRREEKNYSLGDLQQMLMEMAQGFDTSPSRMDLETSRTSKRVDASPSWMDLETSRTSKRARHVINSHFHVPNSSHFHVPGFHMFGNAAYRAKGIF